MALRQLGLRAAVKPARISEMAVSEDVLSQRLAHWLACRPERRVPAR